jgi:hypothetical protein
LKSFNLEPKCGFDIERPAEPRTSLTEPSA